MQRCDGRLAGARLRGRWMRARSSQPPPSSWLPPSAPQCCEAPMALPLLSPSASDTPPHHLFDGLALTIGGGAERRPSDKARDPYIPDVPRPSLGSGRHALFLFFSPLNGLSRNFHSYPTVKCAAPLCLDLDTARTGRSALCCLFVLSLHCPAICNLRNHGFRDPIGKSPPPPPPSPPRPPAWDL